MVGGLVAFGESQASSSPISSLWISDTSSLQFKTELEKYKAQEKKKEHQKQIIPANISV